MTDQFDFHQYNLRKGTLRAYISMIRWADHTRGHRFHVRAALNLVRVYMRLYDAPKEEALFREKDPQEQELSEEEKKAAADREARRAKKAAAKQRAAEEKAAAEAAEKAAAAAKGVKGRAAVIDPDPEGLQLVRVPDVLVEATRFVQHLARCHQKHLITHTLAVAIYLRREKYLLALRHLLKAISIDAHHPDTHVALTTFLFAIRTAGVLEKQHALVREVLERESSTLGGGGNRSIADLNREYLSAHPHSLPHRLAVSRVLYATTPLESREQAISLVKIDAADAPFTRTTAEDALRFLSEQLKAPEAVVESFRSSASKRFPIATAFGAEPKVPVPFDASNEPAAASSTA